MVTQGASDDPHKLSLYRRLLNPWRQTDILLNLCTSTKVLISTDLPPVDSPLCKGGIGGILSSAAKTNPPLSKGDLVLRKIDANQNPG